MPLCHTEFYESTRRLEVTRRLLYLYRVGKKPDHFKKYMTPVYDEVGRQSVYQNVELFIGSKPNIRNVAIIKYSWHKFGETILRRKYQLI